MQNGNEDYVKEGATMQNLMTPYGEFSYRNINENGRDWNNSRCPS